MPIIQLPSVKDEPTLEEVVDYIERLRKELTWLLDKNIDTKNARELGGWLIRPDKIVSIDGDVGMSTLDTNGDDIRFFAGDALDGAPNYKVTKSGILTAVAGLFMSALGYPRVEFNSGSNLFAAYKSTDEYIAIDPDLTGSPTLTFESPSVTAFLSPSEGLGAFWVNARDGDLILQSQFGTIFMYPGDFVKFENWTKIKGASQTLQQVIDALESQISQKQDAFTSGDVTVIDGVATLGNNINVNKLANGSVSDSEFQYLDGVTSPIQTQLNTKVTGVIKQGSGTTGSESSSGGFFFATLNISYTGFTSAPKVHATNTATLGAWISAITPISSTSATIFLSSSQTGFVAGKTIDWTAIGT